MDEPKKTNVIQMPIRATPIPHPIPFGTPSPEDALIEMVDLDKKERDEAK